MTEGAGTKPRKDRAAQVETLILVVLSALVVLGLIVFFVRDSHRKNTSNQIRENNKKTELIIED